MARIEIGASDGGLDLPQLCQWMQNMFDGSDDAEFEEGIKDLLYVRETGEPPVGSEPSPAGSQVVVVQQGISQEVLQEVQAGMETLQRQYSTLLDEMQHSGGVLVTSVGRMNQVSLRKLKEDMSRLHEEQQELQERHLLEPHNDQIEARLDEVLASMKTMRAELKTLHTDVNDNADEEVAEHPLQTKESEARVSVKSVAEAVTSRKCVALRASAGLVVLGFWEGLKARSLFGWRQNVRRCP